MYDAWKSPKTLEIVSKIAGIDLEPVIDIEIGNINVSVQEPLNNYQKQVNQSDDDVPVTKWHHDSYPFVCVVMMSDTSQMVGGETAIRTGSGDLMKVRGPAMVSLHIQTDKRRALTIDPGLCRHFARPMHPPSSSGCHGRHRAHHDDHGLSTP